MTPKDLRKQIRREQLEAQLDPCTHDPWEGATAANATQSRRRERGTERLSPYAAAGCGEQALRRTSLSELEPIDASNLGHRMLSSMGWEGGALGANGTGLSVPIAARVRHGREGLGM